jgi:hypothetical protein
MKSATNEYKSLLERFLSGGMTGEQFQLAYLDKFKSETTNLDEDLYELLDALFVDVDAFVPDPELLAQLQAERPGFYLDERSLRDRVSEVVRRLDQLEN